MENHDIEAEKLFELLFEDAFYFKEQLEKQDNQFMRRAYVRSVFAAIEGNTFNMKQTALLVGRRAGADFSEEDIALLKEESYDLNDKGEAYSQTKFIQLPKNVRFAFKTYAHAFQVNFELKVDDKGWMNFKEALDLRHRLTHPKSVTDINVTDADLTKVKVAEEWYARNVYDLFVKCLSDSPWFKKFGLEFNPSDLANGDA
jgi:hypothetical protein